MDVSQGLIIRFWEQLFSKLLNMNSTFPWFQEIWLVIWLHTCKFWHFKTSTILKKNYYYTLAYSKEKKHNCLREVVYLCNKLISSFLPHLSFNWRTFSRRVIQYAGDVSEQKFKYRPIRTREITDIRLLHVLYVGQG